MQLPPELWADLLCGCQPTNAQTAAPVIQARAEIVRLKAAGYGHAEIARSLNRRSIPTPSGRGQWWPDTVRRHTDPLARARWNATMRRYRATRRTG